MSFHVMVGGRRPLGAAVGCDEIDEIERQIIAASALVMVRCDHPRDLPYVLRSVVGDRGRPIDILDLIDHGSPGALWMGEDLLFASDENPGTELVGIRIAADLAPLLAETAHVRLLGCSNAPASGTQPEILAGRMLLIKLARALGGHRTVFGTIDAINPMPAGNFSRFGFLTECEESLLFSSLAAIDMMPPDYGTRAVALQAVRPPYYSPGF